MITSRKEQSKSPKGIHDFFTKHFKDITIERIVYVSFGIYLFTSLLTDYTVIPETIPTIFQLINLPLKLLRYLCYIVFLYKSYIDIKQDKKVTLAVIIFAILSILSFIFSRNQILLILFCILVGLRKMDIHKLIKIAYYISISIFLFTISLSLLGAIPNWTFGRENNIIRNSLGFIYATDCISIYLAIILMYFYLNRSNAKIFEIILLETLNLFLYKATDGRLSFILITALLAILLTSKFAHLTHTKNKNKYVSTIKHISRQLQQRISRSHLMQITIKLTCYILPTMLFVTYNALTVAYMSNPYAMGKIDRLISYRLKYTAQAYENYQVPLFGKNIAWQGWGGYGYIDEIDVENFEYNFVDSSYARPVLDFGVIYTIAIIFAYTYSLVYYFKKKNYWAIIVIIFVLVWSFIEPYIFDITRNPLILLLIPALELGTAFTFQKEKSVSNS